MFQRRDEDKTIFRNILLYITLDDGQCPKASVSKSSDL